MKLKNIALSLMTGLLLVAISLPLPHQVRADEGPNLLNNPSFEGGWYDVQIGQVPNGWEWHWLENTTIPGSDRPALRPESRVLPKSLMPPAEHDLYFLDGEYCIKIFKPEAPIYIALSQNVGGLEVGRRYRFVGNVFVDVFNWAGSKITPGDPYSAQLRMGAGPTGSQWLDEGAINYSNWWTGANTSPFFLSYVELDYEFVATAAQMTVYVEMAAKWGLSNNGFFLDDFALYAGEAIQTPTNTPLPPPPTNTPGPSPTPLPTPTPRPDGAIVHIVQSGDTLYGIAIQYGVPVEQIEALNVGSIPANKWLTVGQELVIAIPETPPTAVAPTQPPAETSPAPTEETSAPGPAGGGSVCVLAYHDRDGDTFRQEGTEERLPNAVFSVVDSTGAIAGQYTTDALSEPYCFTGLQAGTYRVDLQPPPGYINSGASSIHLALSADGTLEVAMGAQRGEAPPEEATAEPGEEPSEDGESIWPAVWRWAARISGILMLAAAIAVAVFFFLSRRRP